MKILPGQGEERIKNKIGVFEVPQHAQVHNQRDDNVEFAIPLVFGGIDQLCKCKINSSGEQQEDEIRATRFIIEIQLEECDEYEFWLMCFAEAYINP